MAIVSDTAMEETPSSSLQWVLQWQATGVGIGPADPTAARPIIWQTGIFIFTLYQFSWTWCWTLVVLSLWSLSFSVIYRLFYYRSGRDALGCWRLAVTEHNIDLRSEQTQQHENTNRKKCIHCGQLILRKISKFDATMSDFKAKMHQIRFPLVLRPRPRWGSL